MNADVNVDGAHAIVGVGPSNQYYSQGSPGPSVEPEKCKNTNNDLNPDPNLMMPSGLDFLQGFETLYLDSPLSDGEFLQAEADGTADFAVQLFLGAQLYAMNSPPQVNLVAILERVS